MALKFFLGKIRMCDNEWLSTLPLWTDPDQLMFWHPGDFNETWMGCWDRPFPKHFRTACFRCQRGMTMQFVRIPENPGASLHLCDFWTDLQLVGRRWHPKGSFSTIFQMIQWYLICIYRIYRNVRDAPSGSPLYMGVQPRWHASGYSRSLELLGCSWVTHGRRSFRVSSCQGGFKWWKTSCSKDWQCSPEVWSCRSFCRLDAQGGARAT